jgi:hypothetical protein
MAQTGRPQIFRYVTKDKVLDVGDYGADHECTSLNRLSKTSPSHDCAAP